MNKRLGVLFLLGGALAAYPAFAGDSATMKCDASHNRVWVYDSLTTFDVSAKLNCGETVEITGRVKGYVKIHAANGTEGYVPDTTFPDLPPFVDPNAAPVDTASLAKRMPARAVAHPVAIASTTAAVAATPAAAAPIAPAPKPAPSVASVAAVAPVPTVAPVTTVAQVLPAAAPPPAPIAQPVHLSTAPSPKPIAPASSVRTVSETSPAPTESTSMTIEPVPAAAVPVGTTGARSSTTPAPGKKSTTSVASGKSANTRTANSKSAATQPQPGGSAHPAPTPSVPTPAASSGTRATESTASAQPPHEVPSVHTVAATESDEDPGYLPENASADPACQRFFSAYGLSPAQAKWIAQNRKKQFSSVCPAPDPSKIDFVIIFTHDVDFFGGTLPTEIHRDHGFSDFSPMTTIDSALIPESEANKARREYVWVFKMQRGAFDPAKFSPRRHPQFSKTETHAPARTVEEAFQFIEGGGMSQ
jgi:hypothetical protein